MQKTDMNIVVLIYLLWLYPRLTYTSIYRILTLALPYFGRGPEQREGDLFEEKIKIFVKERDVGFTFLSYISSQKCLQKRKKIAKLKLHKLSELQQLFFFNLDHISISICV